MTKTNKYLLIWLVLLSCMPSFAQFPPAAGQEGSTAIHCDDDVFVAWATGCVVERGPQQIDNATLGEASYGTPEAALGKADGTMSVVSLGDGGTATLTFGTPICNGDGPDFAVFENGFDDNFLELAFVEVSSDGTHFFRFPSISLTPSDSQVGSYSSVDCTKIHNLAGKYRALYGTPFDLDDLDDDPLLDKMHITHVRVIDVVGCINPDYATYDSQGNIVNDPWPTPFASSGFDLDAVGVIHEATIQNIDDVEMTWSIYPNPCDEILYFDTATSCVVYDNKGNVVTSADAATHIITSGLTPGLYHIKTSRGCRHFIKK